MSNKFSVSNLNQILSHSAQASGDKSRALRKGEVAAPSQPGCQVAQLGDQLHADLWDLMPLSKLADSAINDVDQVIDCYLVSLNSLEGCRRQIPDFIGALCEMNIEVHVVEPQVNTDVVGEIVAEQVSQLVSQVSELWAPCENYLRCEMVGKPPHTLADELRIALHDAIEMVVHQLLASLERLGKLHIVGGIEWFPGNTCRVGYFRKHVVQGLKQTTRTATTELLLSDGTRLHSDAIEVDRYRHSTVIARESTPYLYATASHKHDLMHAAAGLVGNTTTAMPRNVEKFVAAIPDWISPLVHVVDGKLIRDEITHVEHSVEHRTVHVVERDETVFLPADKDPAITFGPFAFTGWKPQEVVAEQRRIEQENRPARLMAIEMQMRLAAIVAFLAGISCLLPRPDSYSLLAFCGWSLFAIAAVTGVVAFAVKLLQSKSAP